MKSTEEQHLYGSCSAIVAFGVGSRITADDIASSLV